MSFDFQTIDPVQSTVLPLVNPSREGLGDGHASSPRDRLHSTRVDASHAAEPANVAETKAAAELTTDEVYRQHTGTRLDWALWTDYRLQSIRTAIPLLGHDLAWAFTAITMASWSVATVTGTAIAWNLPAQILAWFAIQTAILRSNRLYPGIGVPPVTEIRACFRAAVMTSGGMLLANRLLGSLPHVEAIALLLAGGVMALGMAASRQMLRGRLARYDAWGARVLLVGEYTLVQALASTMRRDASSGLRAVGYVLPKNDFIEHRDADPLVLGATEDLVGVARLHRTPIVALDTTTRPTLSQRLWFQFPSLMWIDPRVGYHPDEDPVGVYQHRLVAPFFSFTSRFCKRAVDIIGSALGLLLLAPLFVLIAMWIRRRDPGPIFYASPRVGRLGRRFKMWKFRSMVVDGDDVLQRHLADDREAARRWSLQQKLHDDPRIIPGVGHFLRQSSLDELPQLWNVLRGEMSLVGPRPLPPAEVSLYADRFYPYSHMWPGITGLWQVSGRNDLSFSKRVYLVHHYATHWSIWLDAWILLKTPLTVMTRRGAY